jgi:methyl-accepting chemotaxis protein
MTEATAPVSAGSGEIKEGAPRRRIRNYLIDASLQLRFASYLVAVACALSLALGYLLWNAYRESSRLVAIGDPRVDDALASMLAHEDRLRMVWLAAALVIVVACLLAFAVVVTHRVAGPAVALARICRSVADGDLVRPRPLRRRDLLVDLADEISLMIEALRDREGAESATLSDVAARLRGLGGPAGLKAAEALEKLAAEKLERVKS